MKEKLAKDMCQYFVNGYEKLRLLSTEAEFNNITTEMIDCILSLQNKMGEGASFIRAALVLISFEDPESTPTEKEFLRISLKASVVHYLLTVRQVSFADLGINISTQ